MKRMSTEWQAQIVTELNTRTEPILFSELRDMAGSAAGERALRRVVETTQLTFSLDGERLYPRRPFFRDARVLVRLRDWEIGAGLMIPGHRFLPMYHPHLAPVELVLTTSDGTVLPRRTVTKRLSDIEIYYTLFGRQNLPVLLAAESMENEPAPEADGRSELELHVSAVDISPLTKERAPQAGDYLSCRLIDWDSGTFACEVLPASELEAVRVHTWCDRMATGLERMFEHFGRPVEPDEQIAYAYWFAGRSAVTSPGGHFGGLLGDKQEPKLHLIPVRGFGTALWHEQSYEPDDDSPSLAAFFDEAIDEPEGVTDNLNAILHDVGSLLNADEIEALMRHALAHGEGLQALLERYVKPDRIPFAGPEQLDAFMRYIHELWQEVSEEIREAKLDPEIVDIRARLIAAYMSYVEYTRFLDDTNVDVEDIPLDAAKSVGQFFNMLSQALAFLNDAESGPNDEFKGLLPSLDQLESTAEGLLNELDAEVNRTEPSEQNTSVVFELRIALEDIRPQIWRKVRVPGTLSLDDLHDVIQAVMPWDNDHLHVFRIRGYTLDPEHGEGRRRLQDLELKEKQRFRYIYDLGDNWVHNVLVSKIRDADELPEDERNRVRCLGGKRAAPPEDCGGAGAYSDLEELLKLEPDSLTDAQRERLEWVGSRFDLDFFDLEAANATLKARFG